jgi:hypothetical protein
MYKIVLNMSIIILIKFVSPQHRRRCLAPAPHCLPRRTQDPAAVSPRLPTASLNAPKIPSSSRPGSPLPPSTHPRSCRRLARAPHCLPRRTLGSRLPFSSPTAIGDTIVYSPSRRNYIEIIVYSHKFVSIHRKLVFILHGY